MGLGADPARRPEVGPLGARLGRLYKLTRFGRLRTVADVAAFEAAANPDAGQPGAEVDSNPNSVTADRGRPVVADAGGNDLLRVGRRGRISTLAVFPYRLVPAPPGIPGLPPEIPMQPVPTSVVVGPDGAYYVSELTGFPFPVGAARIYRVFPGSPPQVFASGFTNVPTSPSGRTGASTSSRSRRTASCPATRPGALIRVGRDGSRKTVASEGLVAPTGVAVARDGTVYVSNHGASAGVGLVVRVRPAR